jgi:hypothetical protein
MLALGSSASAEAGSLPLSPQHNAPNRLYPASEGIASSKAAEAVQHQKCSNRIDLCLTLADLFYGSDLPERPSPTFMRKVCIQTVWPRIPERSNRAEVGFAGRAAGKPASQRSPHHADRSRVTRAGSGEPRW